MHDIISAMTTPADYQSEAYLDLQTGEVVTVEDESLSGVTEDDDARRTDEDPDRYAQIPRTESRDQLDLMCRFADTVDEDDIREMLALALRGKGAFGRFRDVVFRYPDLKSRWHAMQERWGRRAHAGVRGSENREPPVLGEVPVEGYGLGDAEPLHHDEAHGVAQGVGLVGLLADERHGAGLVVGADALHAEGASLHGVDELESQLPAAPCAIDQQRVGLGHDEVGGDEIPALGHGPREQHHG